MPHPWLHEPEDDWARTHPLARSARRSDLAVMTLEETAAALALEEGGLPLTIEAIRQIELRALRKLWRLLVARGITRIEDVLP